MRIMRCSAVLLVLIGLSAPPLTAGGFEYGGIGTKARGMAGAFRAIADDWTAAYYNPAGYAYAIDNQLGAAIGLFHLRHELNPNYLWGGEYETGVYNGQTNFNRHEVLSVPSGGFVVRLPVWGETVFGLSGYQPFDNNITWELFQPLQAYNDELSAPEDQYRNNLDIVAFQLTAAREFAEEKLALGVGLQLLRGDLLFNNIIFRDHPLASQPGWDPAIYDRPRENITMFSHNDGRGWGFGLSAGALWTVTEKVKLAATMRVPFDVTIDGRMRSEFYMPDDSSLWRWHESPQVRNVGSVGQLFLSGSIVSVEGDFETKLQLPPAISLGVAFAASEKLTMALDAEYTFWSRFEGLEFSYSNQVVPTGPADTSLVARSFFTSNLSFPIDWDNAAKAMLGASYEFDTYLTLLAGAAIDQSPARNTSRFTPLFVDTGTKYAFSGGFVAHIERWDLGLVTTYVHHPDLEVETPGDFGAEEDFVTFPGEYRADVFETLLSFNYRF